MSTYDVREDPAEGVAAAVSCLRRGALAVFATDTVYGVAADAFSPAAVARLLAAKGRGRDMPVPVLVGSSISISGLADHVTDDARTLVEAFWPGPLTLIVRAAPSLAWDLGETRGTVAIRMPAHPVALAVLAETGPLAVSSANRSGMPAATTSSDALRQLGEDVAVYLDSGSVESGVPSTILDLTGELPRLRRLGALTTEQLRTALPHLEETA
ncbi:MAG: translation factor [Frankiales bacterium]|nr:translation factor [Frankiales bacterium]